MTRATIGVVIFGPTIELPEELLIASINHRIEASQTLGATLYPPTAVVAARPTC